ncbi:MAG TPA: hypothetical protein PK179_12110 [Spirochaetales bacterium]|nr:hypothetical protein [Spirochaetales bacterium]
MRKSMTITLSIAILTASAASLSCSSALVERGLSTIVIQTSPPVGRSLSGGWTMGEGTLPNFSSITVTIRGAGRDPVVGTFDDPSGAVSLTVRPGSGLSVSVSATPDWEATAVRYPDAQLPVLVSGYSGGAVVDAPANGTVSATVSLAPATTRIPVPNPNGDWQLGVAAGLSSGSLETYELPDLTTDSHVAFDKSGLLYVSMYGNVGVFGAALDNPYDTVQFENDVLDFALCSATNRVYGVYSSNSFYFVRFVDLDDAEPTATDMSAMDAYQIQQGGIAVDALGYLYVPAYELSTEASGILRFSVDDTATATTIAFASFEELGLGYFTGLINTIVQDMTIANGVLVVALSEIDAYYGISADLLTGRGMIVGIEPNSLKRLWTCGELDELSPNYPDDPVAQLYGPRRFLAVSPKRLYVLDAGFSWSGEAADPLKNEMRVVAVNLETGAIAETGLNGQVDYFETDYSTYYMC